MAPGWNITAREYLVDTPCFFIDKEEISGTGGAETQFLSAEAAMRVYESCNSTTEPNWATIRQALNIGAI